MDTFKDDDIIQEFKKKLNLNEVNTPLPYMYVRQTIVPKKFCSLLGLPDSKSVIKCYKYLKTFIIVMIKT